MKTLQHAAVALAATAVNAALVGVVSSRIAARQGRSLTSFLYEQKMWATKSTDRSADEVRAWVEQRREKTRAPFALPRRRWRAKVTIELVEGTQVVTFRPREYNPAHRPVVFIHGGAFYARPSENHLARADELSHERGVVVYMPLYGLLPAHTVDSSLPDLTRVVAHLVENLPRGYGLLGDSAGGCLALILAQHFAGTELAPARLVLVSPWVDVDPDDDVSRVLDAQDPQLSLDDCRVVARLWAGERELNDPLVSPIFGDISGLPPTVLYAGTHEFFCGQILRLHQRMQAQGVDVRLVCQPLGFHDWLLFPTPESAREWASLLESDAM